MSTPPEPTDPVPYTPAIDAGKVLAAADMEITYARILLCKISATTAELKRLREQYLRKTKGTKATRVSLIGAAQGHLDTLMEAYRALNQDVEAMIAAQARPARIAKAEENLSVLNAQIADLTARLKTYILGSGAGED